MTAVLQSNQFNQTPLKGAADALVEPTSFSVQIDPASVTTAFYPGDAVKLVDSTGHQIIVDKCAAADVPFAILMFSPKKSSYVPGDTAEALAGFSVIYVEAAETIARGQQLEFVPTGTKVQVNTGNPVCGLALDNAGAADIFRMLIVTPPSVAAAITSGSIDGVAIGGSTPSTAVFTTVEFLRALGDSVVLTPGATVALDAALATNFTLTPGEDETINASNIKAGQDVFILVTTSGVTSRTITFGTGFTSTGTLATGTVDAKKFVIHFRAFADGALVEVSRTAAM